MITYEQATQTDPNGTYTTCRRNGKTQTWKTRPGHFKIPVKYGLYEFFYITHENAADFYAGDVRNELLGETMADFQHQIDRASTK